MCLFPIVVTTFSYFLHALCCVLNVLIPTSEDQRFNFRSRARRVRGSRGSQRRHVQQALRGKARVRGGSQYLHLLSHVRRWWQPTPIQKGTPSLCFRESSARIKFYTAILYSTALNHVPTINSRFTHCGGRVGLPFSTIINSCIHA